MREPTCAHCGQTLPPPWPFCDLHFGRKQKLIVEKVWKAGVYGIRTDLLFDYMYGDDEDGGPLSHLKNIHVMIWHINTKLKTLGLKIVGTKTGHHSPGRYRLVNIAKAQK